MIEPTLTRIAQYDLNILGIPGLVFGDGEIQLFVGVPSQRVKLPAGTKEIIDCIRAREAAR